MKFSTRRASAFFVTNLIVLATILPFTTKAMEITSTMLSTSSTPLYLYIPSINLFTNIQGVGVNEKGNMDVPSGKTNDVGWYQYGVTPGNTGTAVLDAHNTAAFQNLNSVPLGSEIYVWTTEGKWLRFTVTKANTYSVNSLSPWTLFEQTQNKQLNLITCAGTLLGNGEATHRLIVSAELG